MLGCDPYPTASCTSPGGIGGDRSGNALIPSGPTSGASPTSSLGTENGDAGVAELTSEEGSVLFKNDSRSSGGPALPLRSSDLSSGNIFVTGPGAEYAIASPSREASQGFPDRIAVNPLTTLGSLSGNPGAFTYLPALSPTGEPVPSTALRTPTNTPGLARTTGAGSPSTDPSLDFTSVNGNQLGSASTLYTWKGCVAVPAGGDNYTFRFQNTTGSTVGLALSLDAVGSGGSTTTSAAANGGDTNIKVGSVTGFAPGRTITIDAGPDLETAVIAAVGTAGAGGTGITLAAGLGHAHASGAAVLLVGPTITTLAAASTPGATNIKVASNAGFAVGQSVTIDTDGNAETGVITTVGTAGATGTGLTLASALTLAHAAGAGVGLAGPDSPGEGTSTTSCSAAWATLGAASPIGRTLANATTFYNGQYQGNVPVTVTRAGYTEEGLQNRQFAAGNLNPTGTEYYAVQITDTTPATAPASLRFGYSRAKGDIADAAAAAAGKGLAIVFANDQGVAAASGPSSEVQGIGQSYVDLINAVAAANPNTIVVLQSAYADVVSNWLPNVKAMLETWNSGQEGAVATARLLLGQANPSGHTAMTWPAGPDDSIWGYDETTPLYPGDTTGTHPERLNGAANGGTNETEGIYTGYRFFDQEGITPQFPFGFGLSYTTFGFSNLKVVPTTDGGQDVTFTVKNTGQVAGADAVQLYVGPPSDAPAGIQFAMRSLAQFDRVDLTPGQSKTVTLHIPARQLSYWSEAKQQWVLDSGGRSLWVGDADQPSSLPLKATLLGANGNVTCSNGQLNATTIAGNLTVPKGSWCDLVDVTVTGNVQLQNGTGVRIANSQINGNLQFQNTTGAGDLLSSGANVICNTKVTGNVQIQGSSAGAPWRLGGCGPNTFGANLQFQNNQGTGNTISNTTVQGNLQCSGNHDVAGSGNTVNGIRQCQGVS
jgi:hypothetical protein